jgi:hypothetical protein
MDCTTIPQLTMETSSTKLVYDSTFSHLRLPIGRSLEDGMDRKRKLRTALSRRYRVVCGPHLTFTDHDNIHSSL